MSFLKALKEASLPEKMISTLEEFAKSFQKALGQKLSKEEIDKRLLLFLPLVEQEVISPKAFDPYHEREPSYTVFGKEFLKPLIDLEKSKILGLDQLKKIAEQIKNKENVILFANHQTEPDPQAISLLLENHEKELGESIIYVAGHRVTQDPLAIPFSRGCNLLCIFSKKYIESPPEEKPKKLHHNIRTIKKLKELLNEGGKCIFVAPSGGRDRKNRLGQLELAPFDPQSVEVMLLMGLGSKKTHFYPLSLLTYDLLPPPHSVETDLGETRLTQVTPVYLNFGKEIAIETVGEKESLREKRTQMIFSLVKKGYQEILEVVE
jgi:glycerol-3-phosphate O-acyltransferase